jgi:hypothetical protein
MIKFHKQTRLHMPVLPFEIKGSFPLQLVEGIEATRCASPFKIKEGTQNPSEKFKRMNKIRLKSH